LTPYIVWATDIVATQSVNKQTKCSEKCGPRLAHKASILQDHHKRDACLLFETRYFWVKLPCNSSERILMVTVTFCRKNINTHEQDINITTNGSSGSDSYVTPSRWSCTISLMRRCAKIRETNYNYQRWQDCGLLVTCCQRFPETEALAMELDRAIAQAVSRRLPTAAARVWAQVRPCGICSEQSGIGADFLRYFGVPYQFPFHIHHRRLSSGSGIISQLAADVPSGLSLTPPQEKKNYLWNSVWALLWQSGGRWYNFLCRYIFCSI
jgi:hypothetical protein